MLAAKRVLVTGASGFIGRHLVVELRRCGHTVIAGLRQGPDADSVAISLDQPDTIRHAVREAQPDVVVHLAGLAHRRASAEAYERTNHQGTVTLAEALAEMHPGAVLIYASSATVYGDGPFPAPRRETDPVAPQGPYAVSKLRGEHAALAHGDALRVVALRFPALYAGDWLVNVRKRACFPRPFSGVTFRLVGGHASYSFCAIENAVGFMVAAATESAIKGVYNVADGVAYSQPDVAAALSRRLGSRWHVPVPTAIVGAACAAIGAALPSAAHARARAAFTKLTEGMVLDCSRAVGQGYRPTVTLADLSRSSGARRSAG